MIINPKLGDKVLSSNTDSKLAEYKSQMEENSNEKTTKNGAGEDDAEDNEGGEKKSSSSSSSAPPCDWKFYTESSNEYKTGFRIELTHRKVFSSTRVVKRRVSSLINRLVF